MNKSNQELKINNYERKYKVMTRKNLFKKLTIIGLATVMTISTSMLVFARQSEPVEGSAGDTSFSGYIYVDTNSAGAVLQANQDSDLKIEGYALSTDGDPSLFAYGDQTTYISDYVTGYEFSYAQANFTVWSNDGGYNKIFQNVSDY